MKIVRLIITECQRLQQSLKQVKKNSVLSLLLTRARKAASAESYLKILSEAWQIPLLADFSIAALTAKFDNLPEKHIYLRADPVQLNPDLAAVYMYGNQHIQISSQQAQQMIMAIQPLLADWQLELYAPSEKRWYVQLATEINDAEAVLQNCPEPNAILGKDIFPYLPNANSKIPWKILQTEIQMLLHQRAEKTNINSLWFWGAGKSLTSVDIKIPVKLFSNEIISLSAAKHCHVPWQNLTTKLPAVEDCIDGENFIVYDAAVFAKTAAELLTAAQNLEQNFLQPLLSLLRTKKIHEIHIDDMSGTKYMFKKTQCYQFWKKYE